MDENTEAQRGEATHPRMDGSSLAEPYFPRGTLAGRRAWPMKKTGLSEQGEEGVRGRREISSLILIPKVVMVKVRILPCTPS